MRIRALAAAAGVAIRWRPFFAWPRFSGAMAWDNFRRSIIYFEVKGRYMWRDLERICADLDLPFVKPDPFPQSGLVAARVGAGRLDEGWGEIFIPAVYRAAFAARPPPINDPAVIRTFS